MSANTTQGLIKKKYKFGDGTRHVIKLIKEKQEENRQKKEAKKLQQSFLGDVSRISHVVNDDNGDQSAFSDDDKHDV